MVERVTQIAQLVDFLLSLLGYQPDHEAGQPADQGNPEQHVGHVEHGMSDGDMPGDVRTAAIRYRGVRLSTDDPVNEIHVRLENEDDQYSAENIEDGVGTRGTYRRGIGTYGRQLRCDRRTDVFPDDQRHRCIEVDDTGGGQRHRYTQHGRAALDDNSQETGEYDTGQQAGQRLGVEQIEVGNEILIIAQRLERAAHELQAGENQAQRHQRLAQGIDPLALRDQHRIHAQPYQQQPVLAHLDGDDPSGHGGTDVGTQHDPDGLLELHQARIDQTDGHDGGNRAGLDKNCDADTGEYGQHPVPRQGGQDATNRFLATRLQRLGQVLQPQKEDAEAADGRIGDLKIVHWGRSLCKPEKYYNFFTA
jgi:hypothetical protein